MSEPSVFTGLNTWDPSEFLRSLKDAGFTADRLDDFPPFLKNANTSRQTAAARAFLSRENSSLSTAIRLFLLGDSVELDRAMELFGWQITELTAFGLLSKSNGEVRSVCQLKPIGSHLIAADFPLRQLDPSGDYVMGVGPATRQLASLLPPVAKKKVLEIGCGNGWLSLQLAKAGATATATDVNPRAVELARFNAILSRIPLSDTRLGSLFEPIAEEERFDLIFSNPPYVVSPGGGLVYRESPTGAPLCQELVKRLPTHLAPGGMGVVLLNWAHRDDSDWEAAPLSWIEEKNLQVWLHQSDSLLPSDYAWRWIQLDPRFEEAGTAANEFTRWLDFYEKREIRRLSAGFLIIRRPAHPGEPGWVRTESRNTSELQPAAGADIQRLFTSETWAQQTDNDETLLDHIFRVPDGIQSIVTMALADGWGRQTIRLQSPGRYAYDGQVDENLLRLLELTRSGAPPKILLDELQSHPTFKKIPNLPDRVRELVRELLRFGLLIP